jgi:hypothetical protein
MEDPLATELLKQLALDPNLKDYTLFEGVIKYKNKIWVGNNEVAQQHILQTLRNNAVGGHSSIWATYHRIKQLFAWPRLQKTVQDYARSCTICQQAKVEHTRLVGLLELLPIPKQARSVVPLDFIEGLPPSYKYNSILVVIDKCSKYAQFTPLQAAQVYLLEVSYYY